MNVRILRCGSGYCDGHLLYIVEALLEKEKEKPPVVFYHSPSSRKTFSFLLDNGHYREPSMTDAKFGLFPAIIDLNGLNLKGCVQKYANSVVISDDPAATQEVLNNGCKK